MSVTNFISRLEAEKISYSRNENMSRHTTFKVGGKAEIFVVPKNVPELKRTLFLAKDEDVKVFILGNGSNIIVSDRGIKGAVISLSELCGIKLTGENTVEAEAGVKIAALCEFAKRNSLGGLEFACGIPGSVGGAVFMNAGAYGGEIKDVIVSADYIGKNGETAGADKEQMNFGYRSSMFSDGNGVIISAVFGLKSRSFAEIEKDMKSILSRRAEKQPLNFPSAGSVFKRPKGYFAGALIESAGLKGFKIGGAAVSEKHAGFIVNAGGATSADIEELIKHIQETVYEKHGVLLEREIKFVGEK